MQRGFSTVDAISFIETVRNTRTHTRQTMEKQASKKTYRYGFYYYGNETEIIMRLSFYFLIFSKFQWNHSNATLSLHTYMHTRTRRIEVRLVCSQANITTCSRMCFCPRAVRLVFIRFRMHTFLFLLLLLLLLLFYLISFGASFTFIGNVNRVQ